MALPNVSNTVLDGQLAAVNFVQGQTPMIAGVSSTGTANTCKAYAGNQPNAIVTDWGYGPMPQQAARLSAKGVAVCVCKTNGTTAGVMGAVTFNGTGTSVITVTGAPFDFTRFQMKVILGGTIATGPITLQFSFDSGETFGALVPLGTNNSYLVPNTGVTFNFAAGTLVTGDTATAQTTTEPKWNATDLNNALTAIQASGLPWDYLHVVGSMSSTEAGTLKTWLTGLESTKKYTAAICETVRIASLGAWTAAADATWQTALITDYTSFTSKRICMGAGDVRWVSAIDQSVYLRPVAWLAGEGAALTDNLKYELSRVKDDGHNTGALDASLFDKNGNLIGHDENNYPGLYAPAIAAVGFMVARTYSEKGRAVYIAKALMLSPQGSDFVSFRMRRVMDVAETLMDQYFLNELQDTPPTNPNGTIYGPYADNLETEALAILAANLIQPSGRASGATVAVHRTENILSGAFKGIVNVDVRIQPTATIDAINLTLSYTATLPTA